MTTINWAEDFPDDKQLIFPFEILVKGLACEELRIDLLTLEEKFSNK